MHRLRTADATPAVGQARVVACAVLSALPPRVVEAIRSSYTILKQVCNQIPAGTADELAETPTFLTAHFNSSILPGIKAFLYRMSKFLAGAA